MSSVEKVIRTRSSCLTRISGLSEPETLKPYLCAETEKSFLLCAHGCAPAATTPRPSKNAVRTKSDRVRCGGWENTRTSSWSDVVHRISAGQGEACTSREAASRLLSASGAVHDPLGVHDRDHGRDGRARGGRGRDGRP